MQAVVVAKVVIEKCFINTYRALEEEAGHL